MRNVSGIVDRVGVGALGSIHPRFGGFNHLKMAHYHLRLKQKALFRPSDSFLPRSEGLVHAEKAPTRFVVA